MTQTNGSQPPPEKRFATTREAARYASCHPGTLRELIRNGKIRRYQVGNRIRIDLNELDRAMAGENQ